MRRSGPRACQKHQEANLAFEPTLSWRFRVNSGERVFLENPIWDFENWKCVLTHSSVGRDKLCRGTGFTCERKSPDSYETHIVPVTDKKLVQEIIYERFHGNPITRKLKIHCAFIPDFAEDEDDYATLHSQFDTYNSFWYLRSFFTS